ncbi:methionyl-tRNA formyltransferase [Chelativorans salis]|uniref:Methionyl-tRNA formyltransferase n=1 Tax=Chelativorans salis TaxID=2978478 RepID=A0ABT2LR50_9HYPH|nr:methionyl-tRNA formyltransferase [Chelativorans sp. EGI FJ00035]MCT7376929.1 methionyl-tRNA formyltransferase [Chelativorans sp. EGI FJ00035]
MKTAFIGAVEGSAIALEALVRAGLTPRLVVTLPPDAAHRHSDYVDLAPLANEFGSTLLYTTDVNTPPVLEVLRTLETDLALVIGWSQICGPAFRSSARIGAVGFHPAPLPRMRGRAVIPWTILLGETTTAASLFWLDEGVDSGPLLLQETIDVVQDETARTLYLKQTGALARMLPKAMELVRSGNAPRIEQDHARATYCAKRTSEDGLIDWRQPAQAALRLIRAVGDPYPGAFTAYKAHKLIVDAAEPFADSHRFIGLPGQVVSDTQRGFVVRCGDGDCLHITSWRLDGEARKPRLHSKLGMKVP